MMLSRLRHWLMAVMVGLLAACDNNPFPHVKPGTDQSPVAQPKDSQGRTYVIGNLGGKPVNIP
ncbi:hypothetical protein [Snodgrassella sp. CFCC 13594]|uniref:hypothetical protein n=1 Tax=Snodgrassella sp. CFCC 13594 TaxID=1775559 RepID=UPI00082B8EF4|nr:hypothetical protein [Snodgrassella sp. CFCC 13594]